MLSLEKSFDVILIFPLCVAIQIPVNIDFAIRTGASNAEYFSHGQTQTRLQ